MLGEKLGKSISEIMLMPSDEICEWMAYDLTNNKEWTEQYSKERELEIQKSMSDEEKAEMFKRLFGSKNI